MGLVGGEALISTIFFMVDPYSSGRKTHILWKSSGVNATLFDP